MALVDDSTTVDNENRIENLEALPTSFLFYMSCYRVSIGQCINASNCVNILFHKTRMARDIAASLNGILAKVYVITTCNMFMNEPVMHVPKK